MLKLIADYLPQEEVEYQLSTIDPKLREPTYTFGEHFDSISMLPSLEDQRVWPAWLAKATIARLQTVEPGSGEWLSKTRGSQYPLRFSSTQLAKETSQDLPEIRKLLSEKSAKLEQLISQYSSEKPAPK